MSISGSHFLVDQKFGLQSLNLSSFDFNSSRDISSGLNRHKVLESKLRNIWVWETSSICEGAGSNVVDSRVCCDWLFCNWNNSLLRNFSSYKVSGVFHNGCSLNSAITNWYNSLTNNWSLHGISMGFMSGISKISTKSVTLNDCRIMGWNSSNCCSWDS